jgi:hypothetical protein
MMSGEYRWLDHDAGPVVRPYALTKGRTRPRRAELGLIDIVATDTRASAESRFGLGPEHKRLIELCRRPITVADLTSEVDLPLGVVRVLLDDLLERHQVSLVSSAEPTPEESVMRSVLDGLRSL